MAKKVVKTEKGLSKEWMTKLKTVGITASTEQEAKDAMIKFLKKNDIDDCDEDPIEDLFEMVEAMYEGSDEEMDEVADEEVEEVEEVEDDEEESEDDESEDDESEEDDEEEEDEEEAEEEVKKVAKKDAKRNDKVQEKVTKKVTKEETKKATKSAKEKEVKVSKRLNPKEDKDDASRYAALEKVLGTKEFEFNFIANGGVSVKYLGKNSKKVFLSFDSPKVTKDGDIIGRVYLSSVRDEEVLKELFGEDIETKKSWSGNILIVDISLAEVVEAIKENREAFDDVIKKLGKKDEKLGKNREKMEQDLKKENVSKAKSSTKKAAKKVVEEVEEDEEEDEVEVKPAKKVVKKVVKTTKK